MIVPSLHVSPLSQLRFTHTHSITHVCAILDYWPLPVLPHPCLCSPLILLRGKLLLQILLLPWSWDQVLTPSDSFEFLWPLLCQSFMCAYCVPGTDLGIVSLSASIRVLITLLGSLDLMLLVDRERAGAVRDPSLCAPWEPTTSTPVHWPWMNGPIREWVFRIMRLSAHNSLYCPEIQNSIVSYLGIFILNTKCILEIVQKKALEKEVLPITKATIHWAVALCWALC